MCRPRVLRRKQVSDENCIIVDSETEFRRIFARVFFGEKVDGIIWPEDSRPKSAMARAKVTTGVGERGIYVEG